MKLRTWAGAGAAVVVTYLLGTETGRIHYEELKTRGLQLARDPKVQQSVSDLAGQVSRNAHLVPGPFSALVGTAAGLLQRSLRQDPGGTPTHDGSS